MKSRQTTPGAPDKVADRERAGAKKQTNNKKTRNVRMLEGILRAGIEDTRRKIRIVRRRKEVGIKTNTR